MNCFLEVWGSAIACWGLGKCDSEALLQAVRCWGCVGCDRFLGMWGSAIAKRCCKQFAFRDVGVRSRLRMWGSAISPTNYQTIATKPDVVIFLSQDFLKYQMVIL